MTTIFLHYIIDPLDTVSTYKVKHKYSNHCGNVGASNPKDKVNQGNVDNRVHGSPTCKSYTVHSNEYFIISGVPALKQKIYQTNKTRLGFFSAYIPAVNLYCESMLIVEKTFEDA